MKPLDYGWGQCCFCGAGLGPRRRFYCSDDCRESYYRHFGWLWAVPWALERAHFKCQRCGISQDGLARLRPFCAGWDKYSLYAHHIDRLNGEPRQWNLKNIPSNLMVLCFDCHKAEHQPKPKDPTEPRRQHEVNPLQGTLPLGEGDA